MIGVVGIMGTAPVYAQLEPGRKTKGQISIPYEFTISCGDLTDVDRAFVNKRHPKGKKCKTANSKNKYFQIVWDDLLGVSLQELGATGNTPGTIWAQKLRATNLTFDQAQEKCPIGTHPPTVDEFKALRNSVSTEPNPNIDRHTDPNTVSTLYHRRDLIENRLSEQGRAELYHLFPDMKDNMWWWTSSQAIPDYEAAYRSVYRSTSRQAFWFESNVMSTSHYKEDFTVNFQNNAVAVRCVRQPHTILTSQSE